MSSVRFLSPLAMRRGATLRPFNAEAGIAMPASRHFSAVDHIFNAHKVPHPSSGASIASSNGNAGVESSKGFDFRVFSFGIAPKESSVPHFFQGLGHKRNSSFGSEFTTSSRSSRPSSPFSDSTGISRPSTPASYVDSVDLTAAFHKEEIVCREPIEVNGIHDHLDDPFDTDDKLDDELTAALFNVSEKRRKWTEVEHNKDKINEDGPRIFNIGHTFSSERPTPEYVAELPGRFHDQRTRFEEATPSKPFYARPIYEGALHRHLMMPRILELESRVPHYRNLVIKEPKDKEGFGSFKDFKLDDGEYAVPPFHLMIPAAAVFPCATEMPAPHTGAESPRHFTADLNVELDEVYAPSSSTSLAETWTSASTYGGPYDSIGGMAERAVECGSR